MPSSNATVFLTSKIMTINCNVFWQSKQLFCIKLKMGVSIIIIFIYCKSCLLTLLPKGKQKYLNFWTRQLWIYYSFQFMWLVTFTYLPTAIFHQTLFSVLPISRPIGNDFGRTLKKIWKINTQGCTFKSELYWEFRCCCSFFAALHI